MTNWPTASSTTLLLVGNRLPNRFLAIFINDDHAKIRELIYQISSQPLQIKAVFFELKNPIPRPPKSIGIGDNFLHPDIDLTIKSSKYLFQSTLWWQRIYKKRPCIRILVKTARISISILRDINFNYHNFPHFRRSLGSHKSWLPPRVHFK